MEKLSVPIYTVQMFSIYLVGYLKILDGFSYYEKMTITVLLTVIIAIGMLKIVEFWQKYEEKVFSYFKNKLIEQLLGDKLI